MHGSPRRANGAMRASSGACSGAPRRRRNQASTRWSAPRSCRRASPFSGRRAQQHAPDPRAPPQRRRRGAAGLHGFGSLRGKDSGSPRARAAQAAIHGHSTQAGFLGVQMVAPRSIIACAKSPGARAGVSASARRRISGLARGSGSSIANSRATTRSTLPSTGHAALIEGNGGDRGGGIGADARKRAQRRLARREMAAMALDHGPGAGVQVAGAGVIAEPCPGFQHLLERGRGQALDRRPARQEARVVGRDRAHRRLLQHDLGEPDPIGIGRLPRRRAPGQDATMAVVPGEQCCRLLHIGRGTASFPVTAGSACYPLRLPI